MFACNTTVDTAIFQHGAFVVQTVRFYTYWSCICLLQNVLTVLRPTQPFIQWTHYALSSEVNRPWREALHLSPWYQDSNFSLMVLDHYHIFVIKDQINSILMYDPIRHFSGSFKIRPTRCTIFLSMFISFFYMFRATMCSSSGEITVFMRHLVLVILSG